MTTTEVLLTSTPVIRHLHLADIFRCGYCTHFDHATMDVVVATTPIIAIAFVITAAFITVTLVLDVAASIHAETVASTPTVTSAMVLIVLLAS